MQQMFARGIRQLVVLLCLAIIPALAFAAWQAAGAHAELLDAGEATPDFAGPFPGGSVQFVDARSRQDYSRGHAPGAVRLNTAEWKSLVAGFYDAWEPGKSVVVYGRARSDEPATVGHRLRAESGLENVFVFKGIWEEWPQK